MAFKIIALLAFAVAVQAGEFGHAVSYSSVSHGASGHGGNSGYGHHVFAAPAVHAVAAAPVLAAPVYAKAAPASGHAVSYSSLSHGAEGNHYAAPALHTFAAPAVHSYAAAPIVTKVAAPLVAKYHAPVYAKAVEEEHYAPAHYEFEYSVHDPHTHDIKEQKEHREGDVVKGMYSLIEADGSKRIVEYTADHHNGFNAIVHREPATHPVAVKAVAPVAKFVAPVAKVAAVAAPVLRYTQTAPHYYHH